MDNEVLQEILKVRFRANLERVETLLALSRIPTLSIYMETLPSDDILRSAVVFLHATLEDLLRSILYHYFDKHPKGLTKYQLSGRDDLWYSIIEQRSTTVNEFLAATIEDVLNKTSFSKITQIEEMMTRLGLRTKDFRKDYPGLEGLILRRHRIVHSADLEHQRGSNPPSSIDSEQVSQWITEVRRLGEFLMGSSATWFDKEDIQQK